ncbi:MAG: helix-turn-helix domain-containing protein [Defluviicoccus sp.]|nr:helix-turn-helix domain-containing protein [Defluviicoccus sp.]
MANVLAPEKRALAIHLMVEGMSMRAIQRTMRISLNTVYKLHADAGEAALAYHKKVARDLPVHLVQCDEIWSFCYTKQKNVADAVAAPPGAGDVYTWTALDVESKFMLAWEVGDRSTKMAHRLMKNLKKRLDGQRIQLTTDGYKSYPIAVRKAFGDDIDYATLVKTFSKDKDGNKSASIDARTVTGNPDPQFINTSYVEASNKSIRMGNKRYTRETNAYSKRLESHRHSIALFFLYHNFCWAHSGINKKTPAQAIGLADEKKDLDWVVGLIEKQAPKPNRPKTYKKRELKIPETVTIDPSMIGVSRHVGSRPQVKLRKIKPGVSGTQKAPVRRSYRSVK